jgi:hypothetical protein
MKLETSAQVKIIEILKEPGVPVTKMLRKHAVARTRFMYCNGL